MRADSRIDIRVDSKDSPLYFLKVQASMSQGLEDLFVQAPLFRD